MLPALLLTLLSSLAVVHSQETVPNISACIAPPSGQATFTILGQQGPEGPPGPIGLKGDEGRVGKQGEIGERGAKGDKGDRGKAGMVGEQGLKGMKGEKGQRGQIGHVGPRGDPGPSGATGRRGARGHQGDDEGPTGTCNFSGDAYEQLTQDIRRNLTEEIMKELENKYYLIPLSEGNCTSFHTGFKGQSQERPASSCKLIYQCSLSTVPSGYYWINTSTGATRMYCTMNLIHCGDTTGGWTRVAYINMTDPGETCPGGLNYISSPVRMCAQSRSGGCSSVTLPPHEGSYTKVCGRAQGYQYQDTLAFLFHHRDQATLDGHYVDGLSVTHGNPRNHIWTFAAGSSKDNRHHVGRCPCLPPPLRGDTSAPPFVGNHHICESGYTGGLSPKWHLEDPLWDGEGCVQGSTCCDGADRPWFYRDLGTTVTDGVEVRMCMKQMPAHSNVGVEELEIYVS